jgi:hypothetical protein
MKSPFLERENQRTRRFKNQQVCVIDGGIEDDTDGPEKSGFLIAAGIGAVISAMMRRRH